MEIVIALFVFWLICVAFGAFMALPGKLWILIAIAMGFLFVVKASACEGEHKPPYCWQQADGQIFCENQE